MAIAALLVWMCTAAVGAYMLMSRARPADPGPDPEPEPRPEPRLEPVPAPAAPGAAAETRRAKDRFDPPSLARAKSEPLPGMRALAEFAHPALAMIGFAFWAGYVLTRDRVFAAIGFGILLGAICAGASWFTANARGARASRRDALRLPSRLLVLHGAAAAVTLLLTALIAARA